jgi:LPXTG-motif cell wall-anchored protein
VTTHTENERVNGRRIRELREAKRLTPEALARLSSLSLHQVLELENGGSQRFYSAKIKINAARKVAQILAVDDSELLFELPVAAEPLQPETPSQVQNDALRLGQTGESQSSWAGYLIVLTVLLGLGFWWFQQSQKVSIPFFKSTAQPASQEESMASPLGAGMPAASSANAPAVAAVPETLAKTLDVQACNFEGEALVVQAQVPSKASDKVSLMLRKQTDLCVHDSTGKVWREDLKPWLGRNFQGTAPWQLGSSTPLEVDVYFQGEKMPIPYGKVYLVTLNAQPLPR